MSGFNLAARLIAQQRAGQGQGMGQMVSGLMSGFRGGMGQLREDKIRTENREEAQAERDMMRGEREQARTDRQAQQDYGRGLDLAKAGAYVGEDESLQSISRLIRQERIRNERRQARRDAGLGVYVGKDASLQQISDRAKDPTSLQNLLPRAGVEGNRALLEQFHGIKMPTQAGPLSIGERGRQEFDVLLEQLEQMGLSPEKIREVMQRKIGGAAPRGAGGKDPFGTPRRLGLERQLDIREGEDDLSPGRIRGDWDDLLKAFPMPGQGLKTDVERWGLTPRQMPIEPFGPPTQAPVRPAGQGDPGGVGPGGTVPAPNVGGLRGTPGGGGGGLVQMLGRLMGGGGEGGPPGLLPGPGGQAPTGPRNEEASNIPPGGPGAQMPQAPVQQAAPQAPTQQAPQEITQIAAKFMEVDPAMRKRILQGLGRDGASALARWAMAENNRPLLEALQTAGAFGD